MRSKRILVLFRKAPYGSSYTAEGFRSVLGLAAFQADVSLVLMEDGVFWALAGQDPSALNMSPLDQALASLQSDCELGKIYVDRMSLQERGLSLAELIGGLEPVNRENLASLFADFEIVLSF
ncbi:MAG: DsrE family protein [Firmicutes bacterium]|nr:DsrE family protein [Bacillota bacterium]